MDMGLLEDLQTYGDAGPKWQMFLRLNLSDIA